MSFSASIVSKKGLVYAKNIVFWGKSSGIHSIWGINPQINAIETCEEACVGNDSITLYEDNSCKWGEYSRSNECVRVK